MLGLTLVSFVFCSLIAFIGYRLDRIPLIVMAGILWFFTMWINGYFFTESAKRSNKKDKQCPENQTGSDAGCL